MNPVLLAVIGLIGALASWIFKRCLSRLDLLDCICEQVYG